MTRFKLSIALIFAISIGYAQSYDESSLLDNYVAEGLENNLQLIQENLSVDQRWTAIQEARGQFFPAISLQSDYTLAGRWSCYCISGRRFTQSGIQYPKPAYRKL